MKKRIGKPRFVRNVRAKLTVLSATTIPDGGLFYFPPDLKGVVEMIAVIDNYDSFTFNLVQYMRMTGADVHVFRNDEISVEDILQLQPLGIVLSPGPCTPNEAGISLDLVRIAHASIPIFGVCLGHQTIGQAFGASIVRADQVMHGKVSDIYQVASSPLFAGIPKRFAATRYHSLVIDPSTLSEALRITARTQDGTIMGIEHTTYPVFGVQFHPESILSEYGHEIVENFLRICERVDRSYDKSPASVASEVL